MQQSGLVCVGFDGVYVDQWLPGFATSSSRSNLCKLLTSAFMQLTACLSSMDVHAYLSLCRVIVTQHGDHPLRMD